MFIIMAVFCYLDVTGIVLLICISVCNVLAVWLSTFWRNEGDIRILPTLQSIACIGMSMFHVCLDSRMLKISMSYVAA
jgi:hypothetical protein